MEPVACLIRWPRIRSEQRCLRDFPNREPLARREPAAPQRRVDEVVPLRCRRLRIGRRRRAPGRAGRPRGEPRVGVRPDSTTCARARQTAMAHSTPAHGTSATNGPNYRAAFDESGRDGRGEASKGEKQPRLSASEPRRGRTIFSVPAPAQSGAPGVSTWTSRETAASRASWSGQ
jgi:hypothetical protein